MSFKKRKVNLYDIFEKQKECNVTFSCKDPTSSTGKSTIKAHKLILSIASDVFNTMFYGEAAKRIKDEENTLINIEDIQMPAFKLLLSFIYNIGGSVDFESKDIAAEFYYAAHKYNCIDALEFVKAYMLMKVNAENAIVFFEAAYLYENQPLKDACIKIFSMNTMDILNSPNFLKASPKVIEVIYGLDELYITSELQLIYALERYISHNQGENPKILEKVRPAVSHIRFLTLSAPQIAETTLLNTEDSLEVVECLSSGGTASKMPEFLSSSTKIRGFLSYANEKELMRKLIGVYSDNFCYHCVNGTRSAAHQIWACPYVSGFPKDQLRLIYQKYNHVWLQDYSADDLAAVYEIYKSVGKVD